jgi:hypothetical protein
MITDRLTSVVERDEVVISGRPEPDGPMGGHKLCTEQHRLLPRPMCEVSAAHATRKTQIVPDQ